MQSHVSSPSFKRGLAAAAFSLLLAGAANAGTLYLARLNAANENPPTNVTATGTGVLVLLDSDNKSLVSATHNLEGATAGHIHRGAASVNGPVIFPFAAPASPVGPLAWNMSQGAVDSLKAGELYMNFHTAAFPGGAIRGQLMRAVLAPAAATSAQWRLASMLDISAGYHDDLDYILIQTNLASAAVQTQTLGDLTARTVYSSGRQEIEAMAGIAGSLFSFAEEVRTTPPADLNKFVGFARIGDSFGRRSATANQAGADVSRPFILAGVDRWLSENAHGGLALGFSDGRDSFENSAGRTDAQTTSLHGFASFTLGDTGIALDGNAGYGWGKIDSTRNLASLGRVATASPDAKVWAAALKASKAVKLANQTIVTPYATLDVQKATIENYTESGAEAANLVISERTTWNSSLEAGASLLIPLKTDSGSLAVRLQAGWHYLFENGSDTFTTWLVGSPIGFGTQIDGPGRNSAHVEAELNGKLTDRARASLGYRGDLGASGQNLHSIEARVTIQL